MDKDRRKKYFVFGAVFVVLLFLGTTVIGLSAKHENDMGLVSNEKTSDLSGRHDIKVSGRCTILWFGARSVDRNSCFVLYLRVGVGSFNSGGTIYVDGVPYNDIFIRTLYYRGKLEVDYSGSNLNADVDIDGTALILTY